MKVTGIRAYALEATLEDQAFGWSQRVGNRRQTALCVVETDVGIEGYGEAFYFGGPPAIVAMIIERALGPQIVGRDPFDSTVIWDTLYNWTRDQGQKGVTVAAISAVDIALWDIKGKALDLPVYKLLGGAFRSRARAYATGLYEPQHVEDVIDTLIEEARQYKAQGFQGVKLKIGYSPATDVAYVHAIREAIGPELALMVDANHAYNALEALHLAHALAPYNVTWFEEPVPPEDIDGYCELRQRSPIPIAGGECEYTRFGFRTLIDRRAVDILQPDLCATGGFTEMNRIVAMASAANVPVVPHVWGSNVGLAAALQAYAALPNFPERRFPAEPWFELDQSPNPLREAVTLEKFTLEEGYVIIPDRPGLGITLDLDFVEANAHKECDTGSLGSRR